MKRWLKRLLFITSLIIVMIAVLIVWLLTTNLGSQKLIDWVAQISDIEIQYSQFSGNWMDGVDITDLKVSQADWQFSTAQTNIKQLEWYWLSPSITIGRWDNQDVQLSLKENTSSEASKTINIQWPIIIDLTEGSFNSLKIKQSGELTEWGNISMSLFLSDSMTTVKRINWQHDDYQVALKGQLHHGLEWLAGGSIQWSWKTDGFIGKGAVNFDWQDGVLSGDHRGQLEAADWSTSVTHDWSLIMDTQVIDVKGQLAVTVADDHWTSAVELMGPIADLKAYFNVNLDPSFSQKQTLLGNINWHDNRLLLEHWQSEGPLGNWTINIDYDNKDLSSVDVSVKAEGLNMNWYDDRFNSQLAWSLHFRGSEFKTNQWQWYIDESVVSGEVNGEQIDIDFTGAGSLSAGQYTGHAYWRDSRVNWQFIGHNDRWRAQGDLLLKDASLLDPQFKGSVSGHWSVEDVLSNPQGFMTVTMNDMIYQDVQFQSGKWRVDWLGDERFNHQLELEKVDSFGVLWEKIHIGASGTINQHHVDLSAENERGRLSGSLKAVWNQQNQNYSGSFESLSVHLTDNNSQWQLDRPMDWAINPQGWQVSSFCFNENLGKSAMCADIEPGDVWQLDWRSIVLEEWSFLFPHGWSISGILNGHANVKSSDVWDIEATASDFFWQAADVSLPEDFKHWPQIQVSASIDQNKGQFQFNADANKNITIKAEGNYWYDQAWQLNGQFQGQSDEHQWLIDLVPEINAIDGLMSVTGNITSPIDRPSSNIQLELVDGTVQFSGAAMPLQEIVVKNKMVGWLQHEFSVQTRAGAGHLLLTGQALYRDDKEWLFTGAIKGSDYLLVDDSELTLVVSPQLDYRANDKKLTGQVVLQSGKLSLNQWSVPVVTLSDDVHISGERLLKNDPLVQSGEVEVIIDQPFDVAVTGLKGQLLGKIKAIKQQTDNEWSGSGELAFKDGSFQIYGQTLDIEDSIIRFNGDLLDPEINVVASRMVDQYQKVGVKITGVVSQIRTQLFAEPPLSEEETLVYLATGQPVSSLNPDQDKNDIMGTILALGLQNNNEFINNFKKVTGIDNLTFRNQAGQGVVVEAGKQISQRLYVGLKQGVLDEITQWLLRYQINDKWSIESQQGEQQQVKVIYRRKKK